MPLVEGKVFELILRLFFAESRPMGALLGLGAVFAFIRCVTEGTATSTAA